MFLYFSCILLKLFIYTTNKAICFTTSAVVFRLSEVIIFLTYEHYCEITLIVSQVGKQ